MTQHIKYLIGIDGGGTGTRAAIADLSGRELARGSAGPSGLRHGPQPAWQAVLAAIHAGFAVLKRPCPAWSHMALGLGLAGVHNTQWAQQFLEHNPGFANLALETDARTTLLGAHQGQPGCIIALGTGSVGESLSANGQRREVGGWGFPLGDEAGGAWLGQRAVLHLQQVVDGRAAAGPLSTALGSQCGWQRTTLAHWLAEASQGAYARLAPLVLDCAAAGCADPVALSLMREAAQEIEQIAHALDPTQSLPLALCGGLGQAFDTYLSHQLRQRRVLPQGDATAGALLLIRHQLNAQTT